MRILEFIKRVEHLTTLIPDNPINPINPGSDNIPQNPINPGSCLD